MLSVVGILNEISLDRLLTALCVGSTKLALLFHDPSEVLITSWLCHTLHDFLWLLRLSLLAYFPALDISHVFSCASSGPPASSLVLSYSIALLVSIARATLLKQLIKIKIWPISH